MEQYLGVKIIKAEPAIKYADGSVVEERIQSYSPLHKGDVAGYKVIYEDGYESWSPKDVFEKAYRPIKGLNFGLAIEALKKGNKVARIGWNGKGMFLFLDNSCYVGGTESVHVFGETYKKLPSICMKTADDKWLTGWLASQTDMLAEDWFIIEND